MDKKLLSYLTKHKISYTKHDHPAVFTVAESRNIKKSIPGLATKSLFLEDENKKFYLICLPAEKRLNIKQLEDSFNLKKLKFASPEKLKEELNLVPGSVSIFGMIYSKSTILIIDKEIWNAQSSGFHPNINTSTLEIPRDSLHRFCKTLKTMPIILELK